jgi:hypothetical protein
MVDYGKYRQHREIWAVHEAQQVRTKVCFLIPFVVNDSWVSQVLRVREEIINIRLLNE